MCYAAENLTRHFNLPDAGKPICFIAYISEINLSVPVQTNSLFKTTGKNKETGRGMYTIKTKIKSGP